MPRLPYKRKIAHELKKEIDRLENGNSDERQRYGKITPAIAKVCANPLSLEFNKNLPDGYKAVDVLQQYRLFFKLEHLDTESVVFFVWINDEDSIHRSGEPDDCYAVFRKKLARGEIPKYEPDPEPAPRTFTISGQWGENYLYAKLETLYRGESPKAIPVHAESFLNLSRTTEKEYGIDSITVSRTQVGLASALLAAVCQEADIKGFALIHELWVDHPQSVITRKLLEKNKFIVIDTIDDHEIWRRSVDTQKLWLL